MQIFAKIWKFLRNAKIFAKIRKLARRLGRYYFWISAKTRKLTFLDFEFLRKFTDFCETLEIFAKMRRFSRKSVNLQGGWADIFLDFCENAETNVFGF